MDGDLKMPAGASSDLAAELEHDAALPALLGGIGNATGPQECSVDLKLGGPGEFASAADDCSHGVGKMPPEGSASSSLAGAAKRLRAATTGGGRKGSGVGQQQQFPSCTVDGCMADLSSCRDYHRRHKVCEAHSKTPVVTVAGREMRFCQQCSRFQPLKEFDEAKRSCRKRLDGHNRRRRKPQPDTMNLARYMTNQQGTRFSSFPAARPEQNGQGIMGTENLYYTHQLLGISNRPHSVGSTSTNGRERWHFPFLQEGGIMNFASGVALENSVYQPLLETVAPLESSSSNNKMFSDGLTPVLHSDCALSLLSAPANLSGIDASQMVQQQTEHIPIVQPSFSNLQLSSSSWFSRSQASTGAVSATGYSGYSCSVVVNEQLTPVLRSDDNDMNHNGIFHFRREASSDSAPPSPPFPWY